MSKFSAKEVKENTGKLSQFIKYGVQELKVTDITFKGCSTDSEKMQYHVEGRPMDGDFDGMEGAAGQIGTVSTSFLKIGSKQEAKEYDKLVTIARKAGVTDDQIPDTTSLKDAAKAILPLIRGKYVRLKVIAKFYWGTNKAGETVEKYSLAFDRFAFCESLDVKIEDSKLTFDIKNQYDGDRRDLGAKPESTVTKADDLIF